MFREENLLVESSVKYIGSEFVILDPPLICMCTYTSTYAQTCTYERTLKKIWQMYFVNYYQSKNHKQRYKIKKLLRRAITKCWIITPSRALGSRLHFLNVWGKWEWIFVAVWITHFLYFIYVYSKPSRKKIYGARMPAHFTPRWITLRPPRAYVLYGWPQLVSCPKTVTKWHFDSKTRILNLRT